jgi:pyruvate carboxylase subunit B
MIKKILFMDTSYRDGFQSYFGARVLTDDFVSSIEAAVDAGIDHFEAGGGARFQAIFMYCGESAFDMMDRFRKAAGKDVKLQTLARGINVVALSAQPKDMIDLHAKMFKKHGMTHIRNFDALNDVRNLEYSGKCIKDAGLHHQVVISLMDLPPGCTGAHDTQFYLNTLKQILDSGLPFDSICFKDASGTSHPQKIYDTIKRARKMVGNDVFLWHHTHETASLGISQYKASIAAGVDGICLSRKPVSGGTGQPDIISMWHALKNMNATLDIDYKKILDANALFEEGMKDYFFPPEALAISPDVVLSPMPGGALTANTMMMRDTGTLHLYPKVIEAMSECVSRGGFGTSVTPVSQFYFQQAYSNVTQGPWKKITDGYGKMVLGYFGRTPVPPDPEIVKIAEKQMGKPKFDGDPLEILSPGIPKAKDILEKENLPVTDENIFIVGALATPGGNKGLDFLKGNFTINVRKKLPEDDVKKAAVPTKTEVASDMGNYIVTVEGKSYDVTVEEKSGNIQSVATSASTTKASVTKNQTEVKANLPGNVHVINVSEGDQVKANDCLMVLEAMKMETEIKSPVDGQVISIVVLKGEVVKAGQILAILG